MSSINTIVASAKRLTGKKLLPVRDQDWSLCVVEGRLWYDHILDNGMRTTGCLSLKDLEIDIKDPEPTYTR